MKNKNLFRSSVVGMRQLLGFKASSRSQHPWRNRAVYINTGTYKLDQAKMDEEATLSVLKNRGERQQIPKFTASLKNAKNLSLDVIDSELFLPRINGHN